MKRKFLNFTLGAQKALMVVLLLLAIATLACFIASRFVDDSFLYALMYLMFGEVIIPSQILVTSIMGPFNDVISAIISATIVTAVFFVILIVAMVIFSKKKENKGKVFALRLIFSFLITAFFVFGLILFILNGEMVSDTFGTIIEGEQQAQKLIESFGPNLINIKMISISAIVSIWSLITFIMTIVCKNKIVTPKIIEGVTFYSLDFLKEDGKNVDTDAQQKIEQLPSENVEQKQKPRQQAQDLITRIMQLNELKDTGKISEVEYTKLRQKAIKRYKG